MLRFTFSLLVLGGTALSATAQDAHIGFKAGYNASRLHTVGLPEQVIIESKIGSGFHAGVFYAQPLGRRWAAQTELLYTKIGDRYTAGYAKGRTRAAYLTLPLLAKFYPLPHLSVQAGPQAGWLLAAHNPVTYFDINTNQYVSENRNITSYWNRLAVAAVAGLGYEWDNGLSLTARYVHNLRSIGRQPAYFREIQASVGYGF